MNNRRPDHVLILDDDGLTLDDDDNISYDDIKAAFVMAMKDLSAERRVAIRPTNPVLGDFFAISRRTRRG